MTAMLLLLLLASLSVLSFRLTATLPDWRSLALGGICIVTGLIGLFVCLTEGLDYDGPGAALGLAIIGGLMYLAVGGALAGMLVRATILVMRGEPDIAPVPLRRLLRGLTARAILVFAVASWVVALRVTSGR